MLPALPILFPLPLPTIARSPTAAPKERKQLHSACPRALSVSAGSGPGTMVCDQGRRELIDLQRQWRPEPPCWLSGKRCKASCWRDEISPECPALPKHDSSRSILG